MKLIFVNRFFHPDHSATSQMLSDLAFAMAARGMPVHVVTSRQRYDAPDALLTASEAIQGVVVDRVWTTRFGRFNLVGRAMDYVTYYASAAAAVWRLARAGDVVVCKTDPPMLSVVLAPLVRLRGARLVNWLQDLFPEVAMALGFGRRGATGLVFRALGLLRNASLRAASANVVLGERMRQCLIELGIAHGSITIVPNWADGQLIEPVEPSQNPLRQEWALEDAFVAAYSGNLGRAHDIATFLDAMTLTEQSVGQSKPEGTPPRRIVWLFIGGGAQYEALAGEARKREVKSLVLRPYQPRERLAASLSVADVHLISLKPELEGLIVPSKLYGVLAAGRASIFIGDQRGEIANVLEKTRSGVSIPEGDGAALARVVQDLAADPERCQRMGVNARHALDDEFDLRHALQRWEGLFRQLAPELIPPAEDLDLARDPQH